MNLSDAQADRRARAELMLDAKVASVTDELCAAVEQLALKNYQQVTPGEKKKLSGLLKHYAKMSHPFSACVRDNTKRFGPDRAKRVCAVLKDIIKGTTKWRKGPKKTGLSLAQTEPLEAQPEIDSELFSLLDAIGQTDYRTILDLEGDAS